MSGIARSSGVVLTALVLLVLQVGPICAEPIDIAVLERMAAEPVPDVPVADDISALDRVELRREVSRVEGRLSDLRKEHDAAVRGLRSAPESLRAGRLADLERIYRTEAAEARERLRMLLGRQADIDPRAPDQKRLRDLAAGE
jgi:hypothetical protein